MTESEALLSITLAIARAADSVRAFVDLLTGSLVVLGLCSVLSTVSLVKLAFRPRRDPAGRSEP